jgi:hypothetical protein
MSINNIFETTSRLQVAGSRYAEVLGDHTKVLADYHDHKHRDQEYRETEQLAAGFLSSLQELNNNLHEFLQDIPAEWEASELKAASLVVQLAESIISPWINTIAASHNHKLITVYGQGLANDILKAAQNWNELIWQLEQDVEHELFVHSDGYEELVALARHSDELITNLPTGFVFEFEELSLVTPKT